MNSINSIQDAILSKYYSNDKTWIEFFNSIPKNEKCTALYNWLPYFIDPFLEHTYIEKSWYIDIDSMPKTRMEIVKDTPKVGGSRKTRKTRRTPRGLLFTNIKLHGGGGNGHIFDEL